MPEGPTLDEQARLRVWVRGRVQGVFFRDFTHGLAERLGVVGQVRNLSDGRTVEVIAEGTRTALESLLPHLRQGPPFATVAEVDLAWETPTGEFTSFGVG